MRRAAEGPLAPGPSGEVRTFRHLDPARRVEVMMAAVERTRMPMVVTDPRQHDNPIVYVNPAFVTMTGYAEEEIVGRNCRFLQGRNTDRAAVGAIRAAVAEERVLHTHLINYRKNGESFWNQLYIAPVYDERGELLFFFGSQLEVTERVELEEQLRRADRELEGRVRARTADLEDAIRRHRVRLEEAGRRVADDLEAMASLLSSRDGPAAGAFEDILRRIEALRDVCRLVLADVEPAVADGGRAGPADRGPRAFDPA